MQQDKSTFFISWSAIFKITIAVIGLYILYRINDILVWVVFALVIGILFNYVIDLLEKKRIPRVVSAIALYGLAIAASSFFIYKTAPLVLNEIQDFSDNLPRYLSRISPIFEKVGISIFQSRTAFIDSVKGFLGRAAQSPSGAISSVFGGLTSAVFVLSMAFFISVERRFVERVLIAFSPTPRHQEYLVGLWRRSKRKVTGWFLTRIIGVLFVGAFTYISLIILDVKYAFMLSLVVGFLDIVPIIGPIIGGGLLFFFVSLISLPKALFAVLACIIVQLLENNLLFPLLFKRFMGISPVLVLLALAVGGKLWGGMGAILAIPLAGVLFEILKDYLTNLKGRRAVAVLQSSYGRGNNEDDNDD